MPRNWKYDAKLMAVVGRKGRGKSTLSLAIMREFPAVWKIGYDHKGEMFDRLPAHRCTNYKMCLAALEQTQSCIFDPRLMFGADVEGGFENFCGKMFPVMQQLPGSKIFYFDEPALLCPDNWSLFKKHSLHPIISDGRSWEINVLVSGQAPTDMTLKFRNQVTHWFTFSLGCEEAMEPLKQYGYRWEDVQALERFEFIAYDHNTGEIFPKQKTAPDQKR